MDRLTKEHRSWNMSRIRSGDTKLERIVRSAIHRLGYRFRLKSGVRLPGKPDIVLPKYRTIIFVHGCFWHRHAGCGLAYTPKSRLEFWTQKFDANVRRDILVRRQLRRQRWHVIEIWECQTRDVDKLDSTLSRLLPARTNAIES
jgi:DNA mismatch endonuclease (patch repair protein)